MADAQGVVQEERRNDPAGGDGPNPSPQVVAAAAAMQGAARGESPSTFNLGQLADPAGNREESLPPPPPPQQQQQQQSQLPPTQMGSQPPPQMGRASEEQLLSAQHLLSQLSVNGDGPSVEDDLEAIAQRRRTWKRAKSRQWRKFALLAPTLPRC
eukprot:g12189.t1